MNEMPIEMPVVSSVNVGSPRPTEHSDVDHTGIDKRPQDGAVEISAPGRPGHSGLAGDVICDVRHHGGDDQAVYAYAREDLDAWQLRLGRDLRSGMFGENLTTSGLDVTDAVIGERWRVGDALLLEVSSPRIPCRTFAGWLGEHGWIKIFTEYAQPGTYLRVVEPGLVRAGDPIAVVDRPDHGVTVGVTFRALTRESDLLPLLPPVEALPEHLRDRARRRLAAAAD
jgi:MOSC domain-containing protein YiiM